MRPWQSIIRQRCPNTRRHAVFATLRRCAAAPLDHKKRKMNQRIKQTIKPILIGIIVLPLIGLLYDAFNGFYVMRNSKSIYGIIAGLIVTVFLVFAGEYVSEVINTKDKVSDPLYKRAFHLFVLLASVGVVLFLYWFIFHYFEILNI
jgi:hypothetical protein